MRSDSTTTVFIRCEGGLIMDPLVAWNLNVALMAALLVIVVTTVVFLVRRFLRRYRSNENQQSVEHPNLSRED